MAAVAQFTNYCADIEKCCLNEIFLKRNRKIAARTNYSESIAAGLLQRE
ncbi:MAG: hypothetical protein JWM78_748 [Verrucomicrobiaceae bacterium]|nr:hypothetical protein [Verrucomicrobiaceae bacterium]